MNNRAHHSARRSPASPRRAVRSRSWWLLAAWLLALPCLTHAQGTHATLLGTVRDQDGAIILKAAITARDLNTGLQRNAVSNEEGNYTIELLPVGVYQLEAKASGFKRLIREGVTLQVNQSATVDFTLEPGGAAEVVTVQGDAPLVNTHEATVGQVIDSQKVIELPLNGRRLIQLTTLSPGVQRQAPNSVIGSFGETISANGAREYMNNFMIDGIDNNDPAFGTLPVSPSIEAVQEFKVQTATYSAEFGRNGGAQISIVTRSGTNALHGSVFHFLRNSALDAKNFFDDPAAKIPAFRQNQFGFVASGPFVKNKAFWLVNYEGTRIAQAITRIATVPTELERVGDFSQSSGTIIDPRTRAPFPNNIIPLARRDGTGLAIAAFYPSPNRAGATGNLVSAPLRISDEDFALGRIDYRLGERDTVFARFMYSRSDRLNPFETTNVPGFGNIFYKDSKQGALTHTHVFGANTANEFRLGMGRIKDSIFPQHYGTDIVGQLGIQGVSRDPIDTGFPVFTIRGFDPLSEGNNQPQIRAYYSYHLYDTFSYIRGNHSMKIGVEGRRYTLDTIGHTLVRGQFQFQGNFTGNGLADLLLGLPTLASRAFPGAEFYLISNTYSGFFQDDWKASRRLTLNLGLRYDYYPPTVEDQDRKMVFLPEEGRLVRVGTEDIPRAGYFPDKNNWAPRVGFAYDLFGDQRMVLRGGYGIFNNFEVWNSQVNGFLGQPPFVNTPLFQAPGTIAGAFTRQAANAPISARAFPLNYRDTYMQNWSLGVQRMLGRDLVAEVAYVGSKGTNLPIGLNINQPRPGAGPAQARRPYPQFATINAVEDVGNSSYHSMQAKLERRFSQGSSFLASYTWSKSIDVGSGPGRLENPPQNSQDIRGHRGPSEFDVRHRFVFAYIQELPFGKGRRWLNNGVAADILGDWQTNTIITYYTGYPFSPTIAADVAGTLVANQRPNLVGDARLNDPAPERWFDPSAFALPIGGTFGNAGRNILRGDDFEQVDMSLFRRFRIRERAAVEFRAEVFNLFNHPDFGLPNATIDSPGTVARVRSAFASRQIQFAVKFSF